MATLRYLQKAPMAIATRGFLFSGRRWASSGGVERRKTRQVNGDLSGNIRMVS